MGRLSAALVAVACVCAVARTAGAGGNHDCSPTPAVLASFVSGQDIPESVTSDDDGNLYVSVGNTVQVRAPGGSFSVFGSLPLPIAALGVKVGPDGCVYNASTSLSATPGAFVWKLCGAGSVEAFAELDQAGAPNDLAFDEDGSLFVTDPLLGEIWRIDEDGHTEVFLQHALLAGNPADPALIFRQVGVNGIAFDKHHRNLYVSNTDQGSILRIDMRGQTHTPVVFAQDSRLRGADGIGFDESGELFVAVNKLDALVSVDKHFSEKQSSCSASLIPPLAKNKPCSASPRLLDSSTRPSSCGSLKVPVTALSPLRRSAPGTPTNAASASKTSCVPHAAPSTATRFLFHPVIPRT